MSIFNNIATKIRKMVLGTRFDDNHTLHYFSCDDYENMVQEKFEFVSNGLKLQGYLYQVNPKLHKGNLIFVHGMGVGHIQYTNDIHHYCKLGYDVYTFDGQGCLASEGTMDFFSNYIRNLDDFFNYLKTKEELKNEKFVLVGHSLGGYAVNVISKFHSQDISYIVSFSGFNNVKQLMEDKLVPSLKFIGKFIAKDLAKQDKKNAPEYHLSTDKVILETSPNILFIHGEKDKVVKKETTYDVFKNKLYNLKTTHFMLVKDRFHNPYVSKESANYFKKTRDDFNKLASEYKTIPEDKLHEYYESLDYKLMVELDEKVMNVIDKFILGETIDKEIIID